VLAILRELLLEPLLDGTGCFRADYVESEQKILCDAIRAENNQPRVYAENRCRTLLCDGTPGAVSLYGTPEEILAITPERLTAYYRETFLQTAPEFFYVGGLERERVEAVCRTLFGDWKAAPTALRLGDARPQILVPDRSRGDGLYLRQHAERRAVRQGKLVIGCRVDVTAEQEEFPAMLLMNELFGCAPASKLFLQVRERLSLCYDCSSFYDFYSGHLLISCGIRPADKERTEAEILQQLDAVCRGRISDAELLGAKNSLRNSYRQVQDDPATLEEYYLGRLLFGIPAPDAPMALSEMRDAFLPIGRDAVRRAAKRVQPDTVFFLEGTLEDRDGEEDGYDDEG
jgi:predicted Zn-dependent peptidase